MVGQMTPPGVIIGQTPPWIYILYFVAYIVIHVIIGKAYAKKQIEALGSPDNVELQKHVKYLKYTFQWFPVAYLIFVLAMLL